MSVTKNDLQIMSRLTCSCAATIQSKICCLERDLVGVSVSLICNMYSCHSCLARSFIGLLIETSNGCNRDVQPPGIIAGHTLIFFIAAFTSLVRCPLKESSTKIAILRSVNGRTHNSIHSIIKRLSIHAFSCTHTIMEWNGFNLRFPLKITMVRKNTPQLD